MTSNPQLARDQNDIDQLRREREAVTRDKWPSSLPEPRGPHFRRTRRDFNQQSQPDASWMPESHLPANRKGTASRGLIAPGTQEAELACGIVTHPWGFATPDVSSHGAT